MDHINDYSAYPLAKLAINLLIGASDTATSVDYATVLSSNQTTTQALPATSNDSSTIVSRLAFLEKAVKKIKKQLRNLDGTTTAKVESFKNPNYLSVETDGKLGGGGDDADDDEDDDGDDDDDDDDVDGNFSLPSSDSANHNENECTDESEEHPTSKK